MTASSSSFSLADSYIAFAKHSEPNQGLKELATQSPSEFLATPENERGIAWLGQCIERIPGYKIESSVHQAIDKLMAKTIGAQATQDKRTKFVENVGKHPELYTPPLPAMWIEYDHKNPDNTPPDAPCRPSYVQRGSSSPY
jgi:hypothetical protein